MRNRKLADRGDVRLAFYWSHVQRNFYELATPGLAPIASEALKHIAALYAVERDISGAAPTNVAPSGSRKVGHSATLLNCGRGQDKTWLISQKSELAEAHPLRPVAFGSLTRFIDDGRIELDNNTVERSIRPIATRHLACGP
jgi:transposase